MTDKSDRNAVSCDLQLDWPTKWRKQVFYVAGQIIGFALEWPKLSFDQQRQEMGMSNKLDGFVAKLTALGGGSGTSLEVYEDWAPTYERNLQEDYGYVAHQIAADVFVRFQPDKSVRVLDLACGTGLVGQVLFDRGYANIDGLDVSPGMLAEAKKKQVYGDLLTGDMSLPLELGGRRYQAAIAVGCFGGGHLGPEHLTNIIDCVEPGGFVVLYLNAIPYVEDSYDERLRSLEERGVCHLLCQEQSNYMQGFERPGWSVALSRKG